MEELKRYNLLRQQYSEMLNRPSSGHRSPKRVTFNFVDQYTIQDLRNLREFRQLELDTFTTIRDSSKERDNQSDLTFSDDSRSSSRLEVNTSFTQEHVDNLNKIDSRKDREIERLSKTSENEEINKSSDDVGEREESASSGEISPAIIQFDEEEKTNLDKLLQGYIQPFTATESQAQTTEGQDLINHFETESVTSKASLEQPLHGSPPAEQAQIQKSDDLADIHHASIISSHDSLMRDIESYKQDLFERIVNPLITPKPVDLPVESPDMKVNSKRFSEYSNIDLYKKFCHIFIDQDLPNPDTSIHQDQQSSVDLSESYLKSKLDHLNKLLQPRASDLCNISGISSKSAQSDRQHEELNACELSRQSERSDFRSKETSIVEDSEPLLLINSYRAPQESVASDIEEPDVYMMHLNQEKINCLIRAVLNASITLEHVNLESSFETLKNYSEYYDTLKNKEQLASSYYSFNLLKTCFSSIKSIPKTHDQEFEDSHLEIIQNFQNRWKFIKLHLVFLEMKRICDAHREWVNQVQRHLLHRKLQNYFDSWILFLRYRLAKYTLQESKLKKMLNSWRQWSTSTRDLDMKAYLFWYKTLVAKYTIHWRAFAMQKQLGKIKRCKMQELYDRKLISKVFLMWKNIRQIIASNYIPMRISKHVSVSKASGRLIHKKSMDIKIVNF